LENDANKSFEMNVMRSRSSTVSRLSFASESSGFATNTGVLVGRWNNDRNEQNSNATRSMSQKPDHNKVPEKLSPSNVPEMLEEEYED
jgi:hypothetical protein